jgi:hypothetical protein
MNRKSITLLALAILSCAGLCRGAVFQHDWKTPGDGLLTYDDVNQREWLDLSQTLLTSQFPDVGQYGKYSYVLGQTVTGGIFEGFTIAKGADVIALSTSAGITSSTMNYLTNYDATFALQQLLGITSVSQTGSQSVGLLNERAAFSNELWAAGFLIFGTSQAGVDVHIGESIVNNPRGVMLFHSVVPEPTASVLAIELLILMNCRGQRKGAGFFLAWRSKRIVHPTR